MTRILGLSGSLRKASFNSGLLRAAVAAAPESVTLDAHTLHGVPLYDGDAEAAEGVPPAVAVLKAALAEADALLLVTPEYNNGIPGVFKNAIDWMSRPPGGTSLFKGKPVAVIGASPGGFGTTNLIGLCWGQAVGCAETPEAAAARASVTSVVKTGLEVMVFLFLSRCGRLSASTCRGWLSPSGGPVRRGTC